MLGLASHATHFVMLPVVAGLLILLIQYDRRRFVGVTGSGLFFGLALLMKQPAVFFIAFGATYLLFRGIRARSTPKGIVLTLLIFGSAAALPLLFTCLGLWSANVFGKFWFWTVEYARQYAAEASFSNVGTTFIPTVRDVIGFTWPLWVLAGLGLFAGLWNRRSRDSTYFLIAFLVFSTFALASDLQFRNHYFILALPALALSAGIAVTTTLAFCAGIQSSPNLSRPCFFSALWHFRFLRRAMFSSSFLQLKCARLSILEIHSLSRFQLGNIFANEQRRQIRSQCWDRSRRFIFMQSVTPRPDTFTPMAWSKIRNTHLKCKPR